MYNNGTINTYLYTWCSEIVKKLFFSLNRINRNTRETLKH